MNKTSFLMTLAVMTFKFSNYTHTKYIHIYISNLYILKKNTQIHIHIITLSFHTATLINLSRIFMVVYKVCTYSLYNIYIYSYMHTFALFVPDIHAVQLVHDFLLQFGRREYQGLLGHPKDRQTDRLDGGKGVRDRS